MTPADIIRRADLAMSIKQLTALAETLATITPRYPAADLLAAEAALRQRREYLSSPEFQAKVMRA